MKLMDGLGIAGRIIAIALFIPILLGMGVLFVIFCHGATQSTAGGVLAFFDGVFIAAVLRWMWQWCSKIRSILRQGSQ